MATVSSRWTEKIPEVESLRADAVQVISRTLAPRPAFATRLRIALPVTCLVNNVGVVAPALFDDVDLNDFDRLMHLNVRPALICAKAFVL